MSVPRLGSRFYYLSSCFFFSLVVDIAYVILFLHFLFDIVYFLSYFCVKGDENVLGYLYVFLLLFLSHEDLSVSFISLFSLPSF